MKKLIFTPDIMSVKEKGGKPRDKRVLNEEAFEVIIK